MGATGFDTSRYQDIADVGAGRLAALATLAPLGIAEGAARLATMPMPSNADRNRWPKVVQDARWLADSGSAQSALTSGWSILEIFGASKETPGWLSLALWLDGARSLVAGETFAGPVHAKWACKRSGGERLFFIRNMAAKPPDDVVMLWDL